MVKKILWLILSSLMALSLVMASCGPTTVEEEEEEEEMMEEEEEEEEDDGAITPSPEEPEYGGTLKLALTGDIVGWDDVITFGFVAGAAYQLTNEPLWTGDWAKGPAGGYGEGVTDWKNSYDIWANHAGAAATSWEWNLDVEKNEATIVYQIRQGTRYGLDPNREASALVGGREMTTDDVVTSLQTVLSSPTAFLHAAFPELRNAEVTKTGPTEMTCKLTADALVTAVTHFGSYFRVVPPELVEKYGNTADWKRSCGTGPFVLTDYLTGSTVTLVRNENYWRTDPVGPGRG